MRDLPSVGKKFASAIGEDPLSSPGEVDCNGKGDWVSTGSGQRQREGLREYFFR